MASISERLGRLSEQTRTILRLAALLGTDFPVFHLATLTGRPPDDLLPALREAGRAGLLTETGDLLRFPLPVVRRALYEATPGPVRSALHRQVARALADAGLPVERVAEHLAAAVGHARPRDAGAPPLPDPAGTRGRAGPGVPPVLDGWAVGWLAAHAEALAHGAPDLAVALLPAVGRDWPGDDPRHGPVLRSLARALHELRRVGETEAVVRRARGVPTSPELSAELAWILGSALRRAGRGAEAVTVLDRALTGAEVPALWRARLRAMRAKTMPPTARRAGDDGSRPAPRSTDPP